jgi:hypothetical protein
MIGRLTWTGRYYEMEMNMEDTKEMTISKQPVQIMTDQTQPKNVEYFNYLGSRITKDVRHTRGIKSRIGWQRLHSTRRRLFSPANGT